MVTELEFCPFTVPQFPAPSHRGGVSKQLYGGSAVQGHYQLPYLTGVLVPAHQRQELFQHVLYPAKPQPFHICLERGSNWEV